MSSPGRGIETDRYVADLSNILTLLFFICHVFLNKLVSNIYIYVRRHFLCRRDWKRNGFVSKEYDPPFGL